MDRCRWTITGIGKRNAVDGERAGEIQKRTTAMANLIDSLNSPSATRTSRSFQPGDTVRVHTLIVEGEKERVQVFQGLVIRTRDGGLTAASRSAVLQRTASVSSAPSFLPHPALKRLRYYVTPRSAGHVFFLRGRTGKAARLRERMA